MRLVFGVVLALVLSVAPAFAKRVALVIGNGAYENAVELANPANDATDVAAALKGIGFEVFSGTDLTRAGMESLLRDFVRDVADAELALFFYAGHGMQVSGKNYLIPVDAKLEDATALSFETIDADTVYGYLSGENRVALVFLDACRNNPLARSFARTQPSSRSVVGQGLAPTTTTGTGLFIGFATAPDDVAADGEGRNSPFTTALLKHITEPGVEIQQLMTRVKADVRIATNDSQRPWHNSDLSTEVYLVPGEAKVAATPSYTGDDEEFAWELVKSGRDEDALKAFVRRFPQGSHARQATALLAAIEKRNGGPVSDPGTTLRYERNTVLKVQAELNRLGCAASAPDGIWGPLSVKALTDLSRKLGIDLFTIPPSEDLLDMMRTYVDDACKLDTVSSTVTKIYNVGCDELYQKYLTYEGNKAWAITDDGVFCGYSYNFDTMKAAHLAAIKGCQQGTDQVCRIVEEVRR